jgi:hypothetical protein
MKRFQVSDRFAGMKGPCPSCKTVINIPKAAVKIHGAEEIDQKTGKTVTGHPTLKPLERLDTGFNPRHAAYAAGATFGVFLFAVLIGWLNLPKTVLDCIGFIGLFLTAFPLSLFGYQVLRDSEQLFFLTGFDLYRQTGICAAVYAVLWIVFEVLAWYMGADWLFIWVYFIPFAVISFLITHAVLDIQASSAALHYLIFALPVILLRGVMGLGWLWATVETIRSPGNVPLPPIWH